MNRIARIVGFLMGIVGVAACSPPVMIPEVQTPLDSVAWQDCASDAQSREGRSLIDDMTMDSEMLLCQGVVLSNDEARVDEAVEMLTEAAVTDKTDYRAYFLSGRVLTEAGRYEEALTHFARAKKRSPQIEVPTVRLGKKVIEQYGDLEAMVFLQKANRRGLCEYDCKGMLAELYHRVDRDADANALYEEMLAENSDEPEAYIGLARMHNSKKEFKQEAKLLKKAMKTKGFDELPKEQQAALYHSRAFALYNAGEYEDAQKVLSDAMRFKKTAEWSLLSGWIQMKLKDPAMALIQFEKAVDQDDKLAPAHVGVGDANKALGNLKDARKAYQKAVVLAPTDGVIKLKLAAVYIELKDFDKAKIQLDDAVKLGTDNLPKELLQEVTDAISVHEKSE
ncbi:MAG: tetratricopeptide repeat protein [Deltaproteobacteria bacterium]|nr:tetratricopeptide repeat protein [Deltaproteobacteria bacterium]MBN2674277.1 tetratricopeptide repeat protein [Deltaproteobacteria bacterium]